MADTSLYTRAAVTTWANTILEAEYGSITEVPPAALALLLYGLVNNNAKMITSAAPEPVVAPVTLQEIQFTPAATTAAVSAAVPEALQQRNAHHVVGLLRRVAAEIGSGSAVPQLTLSETLTGEAWVGGGAFIEQLKVWRWLRSLASHWCLSEDQIRRPITAFLTGTAAGTKTADTPLTDHRKEAATAGEGNHVKRPRSSGNDCECSPAPEPQAHRQRPEAQAAPASTDTSRAPVQAKPCAVRADDVPAGVADSLWRAQSALAAALARPCAGNEPLATAAAGAPDSAGEAASAAHLVKLPDLSRLAGCESAADRPESCSSCPAVFALALEANMAGIAKMEKARKRAIDACLRKDMTELISALGNFA